SVLYSFLLGGVRKKKRNKPGVVFTFMKRITLCNPFFIWTTNPTFWFQRVEDEFGESGQEMMLLEVGIYSLTGGGLLYRLPLPSPPPTSPPLLSLLSLY